MNQGQFNQVNPQLAQQIGGQRQITKEQERELIKIRDTEAVVLGLLPSLAKAHPDLSEGAIVKRAFTMAHDVVTRFQKTRDEVIKKLNL